MSSTTLSRARLAQLPRLTAEDLVAQYNRADSKRGRRYTAEGGKTAVQRRIDKIVDLLEERADMGDQVALAWFAEA